MFSVTGKGAYALDPDAAGGRGGFEPHNNNYVELAKLVIGLASASIGAVAVFFFRTDVPATHLQSQLGFPLTLFVACVVYGVLFVGLLSWRYEMYCHNDLSYTRNWLAFINGLGWSMLACLSLGYATFVWILLHPEVTPLTTFPEGVLKTV